jgi:hypothetical protein
MRMIRPANVHARQFPDELIENGGVFAKPPSWEPSNPVRTRSYSDRVDEWESFGEELRKEWLAGRAGEIGDRMRERFVDMERRRSPDRVKRILEAQEATGLSEALSGDEIGKLARVLIAQHQASAENMIIAVALAIAENEPPATTPAQT